MEEIFPDVEGFSKERGYMLQSLLKHSQEGLLRLISLYFLDSWQQYVDVYPSKHVDFQVPNILNTSDKHSKLMIVNLKP